MSVGRMALCWVSNYGDGGCVDSRLSVVMGRGEAADRWSVVAPLKNVRSHILNRAIAPIDDRRDGKVRHPTVGDKSADFAGFGK